MGAINDWFDAILVINMDKRTDRWAHAKEQLDRFGLTKAQRFPGYDLGTDKGNHGCTAAHRAVLEVIRWEKWPKTLVMEDDFDFVVGDPNEQFERMIGQVPEDWDMIYLGGHYAEKPLERVAPNVIRMGRMLTTTAYGITPKMAEVLAPHASGGQTIDGLYSCFIPDHKCYIFQPRLLVQYTNFSDIQQRDCNNRDCMMDRNHESMV